MERIKIADLRTKNYYNKAQMANCKWPGQLMPMPTIVSENKIVYQQAEYKVRLD